MAVCVCGYYKSPENDVGGVQPDVLHQSEICAVVISVPRGHGLYTYRRCSYIIKYLFTQIPCSIKT
jgi:hypothetical protein